MKKDISDELTVFLIAVEKEKNYQDAIDALYNQSVSFTFKEILDVEPFSAAANEMINQCDTPYFCQVDEDMILKPYAIEKMYDTIVNNESDVAMIRFKLHDIYLQKTIGSVVIYSHDISKKFPFENTPNSDIERFSKIKSAGYKIVTKNHILGDHHPHWDLLSIFRKFAVRASKVKNRNIDNDIFLEKIISNLKNISNLDLFALIGYITGLLTDFTEEKNHSYLLKEEFDLFKPYFTKDKFEFITKETNNLVRELGNYLNIEYVNTIEEIKQSNKPVIFWNGNTGLKIPSHCWKKELIDYCKNNSRPYYIFERGALPGCLYLDKHGFLNYSSSYNQENWDKELDDNQLEQVENYITEFVNSRSSLEKQNNENFDNLYIPEHSKIIFVPFQVSNDTVIQLWSDWVESQENFYKIINQLANDYPEYTFLTKNHPVQINKRMKLFTSELPNVINVDNYHYKECIAKCDAVLTINSGVGLQSMMWNKPCIICGDAFYQFNDINTKVNSYDELKSVLGEHLQVNYEKVKKFIYYLRFNFYTIAELRKTGINSSSLDNISYLIFEYPYSKKKIIKKFNKRITNIETNPLLEFLNILNKHNVYPCFLKKSCLKVINNKKITNLNDIHIAVSIPSECLNELDNNGFILNGNIIEKENMKICGQKFDGETKQWFCSGYEIRVPIPVVYYLENLYGKEWRKIQ